MGEGRGRGAEEEKERKGVRFFFSADLATLVGSNNTLQKLKYSICIEKSAEVPACPCVPNADA